MRINGVQQNEAISRYLNNVNPKAVKSERSMGISDSVELSEGAQKFSSLMKEAKAKLEASGSDEEVRVEDIMNRMKEGSYGVSDEAVASSILSGMSSSVD